MRDLMKTPIKPQMLILFSALFIVALIGSSCQKTAPAHESSVDLGDEKIAAEKIAEAERLYEGRDDMARARVAVAALRQARTADYGNYEAAWKLSRASYYVGDHTTDSSESEDMFRDGIEAGKSAIKLEPNKPEGHFWLGANYGGSASRSTLANLSNVQDIRREMEAVLKLDEGFQGGSAYLGLGRLYLQAPRVLGGDTKKAIEYLEKGLRLGPNNSLMIFHLAEAYANENRNEDARKQLDRLSAMTPDPKYAAEHKDALTKSKKLQDKLAAR